MKTGYLYIATGEKYINEALRSLRSLKQVVPHAHATLITNEEVTVTAFDAVQVVAFESSASEDWKQGILYKVLGLQASPYQKTFFVDTDTYFTSSCHHLFDLVEYYDLLICQDQARNPKVVVNDATVEGYEAFNTGVMVYQNNATIKALFKKWLEVYKEKFKIYPHDQPPLMEALLYVNAKIYALPLEYNFRFGFYGYLRDEVKIIHGRPQSFKTYAQAINRAPIARVWLADTQKIYFPQMNLATRFFKKIKKVFGLG
ncbi:MAG: putative nucleotide-diphospho-sugar transferase [Bacteroidota bacterium]